MSAARFDMRTLLRLWPADTDDAVVASALGVSRQRIVDWRRGKGNMVPWWCADRFAISVGTHPAMVWHDWCDVALAESVQDEPW